jgi:hypothetical protein
MTDHGAEASETKQPVYFAGVSQSTDAHHEDGREQRDPDRDRHESAGGNMVEEDVVGAIVDDTSPAGAL